MSLTEPQHLEQILSNILLSFHNATHTELNDKHLCEFMLTNRKTLHNSIVIAQITTLSSLSTLHSISLSFSPPLRPLTHSIHP